MVMVKLSEIQGNGYDQNTLRVMVCWSKFGNRDPHLAASWKSEGVRVVPKIDRVRWPEIAEHAAMQELADMLAAGDADSAGRLLQKHEADPLSVWIRDMGADFEPSEFHVVFDVMTRFCREIPTPIDLPMEEEL
jgi:hypothetical protein